VNVEEDDSTIHAESSIRTDGSGVSMGGSGTVQLPRSIDHCLVFGRTTLETLRGQIGRLDQVCCFLSAGLQSVVITLCVVQENTALRNSFKDLHKQQRLLQKSKKALEDKITEWKAKAVDLQMLKFGQLVDLEALDKMASSEKSKRLESDLGAQEASQRTEAGNAKHDVLRVKQEARDASPVCPFVIPCGRHGLVALSADIVHHAREHEAAAVYWRVDFAAVATGARVEFPGR
jgi:hypothetical protein